MRKRISVANQKGGVGKTTTSVNFAASLAAAGHKSLLIDLDPQGNASSGLGLDRYSAKTIYDVLIGRLNLEESIQSTALENLFVIPANQNLIGAEVELINAISRERKLKTALKNLPEDIEFVIFDCPPSLGLLTINAFTASDSLLIPIQCEYYAMEGLGQLLNTFQIVKEDLNEDLKIEGIVLTMFDPRTKLTHEVVREMKSHFKDELYETAVPRNIKLSEAPSFGKPVILYDHESKGATAYMSLVEEFLKRNSLPLPDWREKLAALFPEDSIQESPGAEELAAETESQMAELEEAAESPGRVKSGVELSFESSETSADREVAVSASETESGEWKSPYALERISEDIGDGSSADA
ncbi:MAG: ParA family protein [Bradymonadales bacterium]|nr:MAG: ParA family protein [Bradymonadales bacterium]